MVNLAKAVYQVFYIGLEPSRLGMRGGTGVYTN
jgi:hypothetical protein